MEKNKILVTGSAGFIGFNLVRKLLKLNYTVVGIDNINDYYDVNVKYGRLSECGIDKNQIGEGVKVISETDGNYSFYKGNLENKEFIEYVFEKETFDYVVNLAAQAGVRYSLTNPDIYIQSNIVGFLNILEASRNHKIKHLLYASSSSVYGLNQKLPFSTLDNVDHPISLYAASKKSNELMAHTYSHLFDIPSTGLRFFTVYGPWGRPDMALFLFTKAILNGTPINVFNEGKMIRDFTYVDDIIESISRLILKIPSRNENWDALNPHGNTSSAPYRIYNIGNNNPVNLMDFIHALEAKLNKKAIINYLPLQEGDVKATFADVEDLQQVINFKPETSVKTGISNFVDWYLNFFN
ncbi:UDP-glucuronate 4-epimerase [Aquirufa nivalisilvae]|uniref:UDP-glucuronate 4-epimerase n=1 Tax=Aquirufa nivalisilvae TaxID=2516557 RepID=A0A2S2DY59_9BACT|nr:NAD-dependent epimerase [Aquirufa nivalisilvae]AWL10351.1 UDP-glucuronate 4-epimerase [Aquirufa nivalisilvae]